MRSAIAVIIVSVLGMTVGPYAVAGSPPVTDPAALVRTYWEAWARRDTDTLKRLLSPMLHHRVTPDDALAERYHPPNHGERTDLAVVQRGDPEIRPAAGNYVVRNPVMLAWTVASTGLRYRFFALYTWVLVRGPDRGLTATSVSMSHTSDPELSVGPLILRLVTAVVEDTRLRPAEPLVPLLEVRPTDPICLVVTLDQIAGAHMFVFWLHHPDGRRAPFTLRSTAGPVTGGPAWPPVWACVHPGAAGWPPGTWTVVVDGGRGATASVRFTVR
jgi:hypothetical protein